MGSYQGNNRGNNAYSNSYNPGWKNHPNFGWRDTNAQQDQQVQRQAQRFPYNQGHDSNPSMEDMMKQLLANQQRQDMVIADLGKQLSQLAAQQNQGQSTGRLPSQPLPNPINHKENVSAVTLRSGKEIKEHSKPKESKPLKENVSVPAGGEIGTCRDPDPYPDSAPATYLTGTQTSTSNIFAPLPFPMQVRDQKKLKTDNEVWDLFRKVEINIPLLDVIKQVPRYAKFLKDLCTNKKKLSLGDKAMVGNNVSAILQQKIPPKCGDPGTFTVPCVIGKTRFAKAMLDLGASINVMPYSIYSSLNLGPLTPSNIIIELADKSSRRPLGMLEDVLVQVGGLVFPADFYILHMDLCTSSKSPPILLGRPFMKTSNTKVDVGKGTLSMEFDDEKVHFDISEDTKEPVELEVVNNIDTNHAQPRSKSKKPSSVTCMPWRLLRKNKSRDTLHEIPDMITATRSPMDPP